MKPGLIGISIVLGVSILGAEQGRVPLKFLQQDDVSVQGHEAVTAVAEFDPASDTGWHTHPGEMVGYMVTGSVVVRQQDKAPETVQAGESFIIPASVAHSCANVSRTSARMFVTYFLEKSKPFRTDVARP